MNIQGKLIIIGGAVDKGSFTETDLDKNAAKNLNFFEAGILKRIIDESKYKTASRIEVITTASKIPKEIKDTNLTQVELGQPISINHLVTHVMSINDTFDLTTFKMTIKSSQYV